MRDESIRLPDGRELAYTDIGEPDWPCLMFFGGAPTSRLRHLYLEEEFRNHRVRVVAPERPGYGRSSPKPGRLLTDWPADVAALADELELDSFIVAGHSSGGPYSIVCAALLPPRVVAAIDLAGATDMSWPEAWDDYNEMEAELMRVDGEEAAVAWCVERFGEDGAGFFAAADFSLTEPDEALFADEKLAPQLGAARAEAFRQGVIGYAHDIVVQARPWAFDPGAIRVPVHIVHGDADAVVPLSHSRHTAELIPGSTLEVLPGHGHFTLLGELPGLASALVR